MGMYQQIKYSTLSKSPMISTFKHHLSLLYPIRTQFSISQIEARAVIRFMRMGRIREPIYRVIAIDSRKKRNTEPIEFLGYYDPGTKEANLNAPAIKKWLSFGAQPSKTAASLFKKAAIIKSEN